MPILNSIADRVRKRGTNPLFHGEAMSGWPFWDSRSVSGPVVDDESALSLTAFYRGVGLIAGAIAAMPAQVFQERMTGGVEETLKIKTDDTAFIWLRPNDEMTMQTLWESVISDEVRGNAYIWVDKDRLDRPMGIWPIERGRVRVGRAKNGQKVYSVETDEGPIGMVDFKEGGEIVHIPNWGKGLVGIDPVRIAKEALGLGLSAQEYASRFFSNDGVPPGYLTTDQPLTQEESDDIAAGWQKRVAGLRNARRIAVLSNGSKFEQLILDPEKAQMMDVRKFQVAEIARLLGLPPHLLADVERTTSWGSGIEEQNRNLMTFTLAAHIRRVELAVSDALLVRELTGRFMRFNVASILRGTTIQQYQAFALGYGRWLTPNDIRETLDMPPIEGGDVLPAPSNMIPIEDLGKNFAEGPSEEPRG